MSNKNPIARHLSKKDRRQAMLDSGRCPDCEIKLDSKYHTNCIYLKPKKKDIHRRKSL